MVSEPLSTFAVLGIEWLAMCGTELPTGVNPQLLSQVRICIRLR